MIEVYSVFIKQDLLVIVQITDNHIWFCLQLSVEAKIDYFLLIRSHGDVEPLSLKRKEVQTSPQIFFHMKGEIQPLAINEMRFEPLAERLYHLPKNEKNNLNLSQRGA